MTELEESQTAVVSEIPPDSLCRAALYRAGVQICSFKVSNNAAYNKE